MRKLITIIVLFFISLPSQAHSGEGQGWVDVLVRVDHTIEAHTSNGDSASYISDSLTPITRDLYYLINNLESDLSQEFEAEADRSLRDADSTTNRLRLRSFSFDFIGPFKLQLIGHSGNTAKIRIGGFNIHMYMRAQDKRFLVNTNVSATITTSPIWVEANYDLFTGEIYGIEIPDFEYNRNTSNNSFTPWGRLFSEIGRDFFKAKIDEQIPSIVSIVNEELSDTSTDLLGLNHVIPDNALTVNGIDLGVHAKDFISEISSTQSVEVSIDRVRYYYNNGNTVVGSEVSINLSDGIFIKAYPRPIVQQEWVPCHPSEPWNCMQVP